METSLNSFVHATFTATATVTLELRRSLTTYPISVVKRQTCTENDSTNDLTRTWLCRRFVNGNIIYVQRATLSRQYWLVKLKPSVHGDIANGLNSDYM